ncbi:MAG: hypothetical protein AAB932_00350 [Patescibacteria group bacterium]
MPRSSARLWLLRNSATPNIGVAIVAELFGNYMLSVYFSKTQFLVIGVIYSVVVLGVLLIVTFIVEATRKEE